MSQIRTIIDVWQGSKEPLKITDQKIYLLKTADLNSVVTEI